MSRAGFWRSSLRGVPASALSRALLVVGALLLVAILALAALGDRVPSRFVVLAVIGAIAMAGILALSRLRDLLVLRRFAGPRRPSLVDAVLVVEIALWLGAVVAVALGWDPVSAENVRVVVWTAILFAVASGVPAWWLTRRGPPAAVHVEA